MVCLLDANSQVSGLGFAVMWLVRFALPVSALSLRTCRDINMEYEYSINMHRCSIPCGMSAVHGDRAIPLSISRPKFAAQDPNRPNRTPRPPRSKRFVSKAIER